VQDKSVAGGDGDIGVDTTSPSGSSCSTSGFLATAASGSSSACFNVSSVRYTQRTGVSGNGISDGHGALEVWGCPWSSGSCPRFAITSSPAGGTLERAALTLQTGSPWVWTETVLYHAHPGFSGTDSFSFRAEDALESSGIVTVEVNVTSLPTTGRGGTTTGIVGTTAAATTSRVTYTTATTTGKSNAGSSSATDASPDSLAVLLAVVLGVAAVLLLVAAGLLLVVARRRRHAAILSTRSRDTTGEDNYGELSNIHSGSEQGEAEYGKVPVNGHGKAQDGDAGAADEYGYMPRRSEGVQEQSDESEGAYVGMALGSELDSVDSPGYSVMPLRSDTDKKERGNG
jgi:hypothetical protein